MTFHVLLQLTITLTLLSIIYRFTKSQQRRFQASKLSCGLIPSVPKPWWDLIGWRLVKYTLKARDEYKTIPRISDIFQQETQRLRRPVSTMLVQSIAGDAILTFSPDNLKAALATQVSDYEIGDDRVAVFSTLLGTGIFSSKGAQWQHSRALLKPAFNKNQISEASLQYKHNHNLMLALRPKEDGWTEEVNLQTLFCRLTMDTSTEMLFGDSVDSQLYELPQALKPAGLKPRRIRADSDFTAAFTKAEDGIAQKAAFGGLHWMCNPAGFTQAVSECHHFIDYYVELALKQSKRRIVFGEDPEKASAGDQKYVFLEELASQTQDPLELRSQLITILLAGRDTTASLLGFLFASLVRHPHIYARLREAILADFGTYNSGNDITFGSLKACAYLQHALAETLRLYPPLPINSRQANKDTTLPSGGGPDGKQPVFLTKGTTIRFSCALMQRDPQYWGDDCLEFKPERWTSRVAAWTYLPFSGGPRMCLGQQFALTSAAFATVRLLQRFDKVENVDLHEQGDLLQHMTLIASPAHGVRCRLHEANDL